MPFLLSRAAAVATVGCLLFGLDRALYPSPIVPSAGALAVVWAIEMSWAAGIGAVGMIPWLSWRKSARLLSGGTGRRSPWVAAAALALVAAAPLLFVATALTRGDWVARQSWAPALFAGIVAGGVIGIGLFGRLYFGARRVRGIRRAALLAALVAMATGLAVANAIVLPGLYPSFHLFLHASTAALLWLAAAPFWDSVLLPPRRRASRLFLGGASVVALSCAGLIWGLAAPRTRSRAGFLSPMASLTMPFLTSAGVTSAVADELARMDVRAPKAPPAHYEAAVQSLLADRRSFNVILLLVDTLRADALPPARKPDSTFAHKGDTPFLDQFLSNSYRFTYAYSQASRTKQSIPPTFRSIEADEDVENLGISLGEQARQLGLTSLAVAPEYFLMPYAERSQRLVSGFDRVAFYPHDAQESLVPFTASLLEGVKPQGFFAWIHFYNMHSPYYASKLQKGSDGNPLKRYRNALRWLDKQARALDKLLGELAVRDDTVIVFTSDHGESLSETGSGHGGTVSEAQVRVPLSIHVPGHQGREIDAVVGNIDIVPTIVDLLGEAPNPMHAGRSLLPLMAGAAAPRALPLYFENGEGTMQGVVLGRQKLIHFSSPGGFQRFDLEADPEEEDDLFDPGGRADQELLGAMLRKNPKVFSAELARPATRRALLDKLRALGPQSPANADVELLFRLAALTQDREIIAECERTFEHASSLDLEIVATKHLFRADREPWSALLAERIRAAGSDEIDDLVSGLARVGQPEVAEDLIAERMLLAVREEPPSSWSSWLLLIRPWQKSAAVFTPPLRALFESFADAAPGPDDEWILGLMLDSVAGLSGEPGPGTPELTALVRPWLDSPSPATSRRAAHALASLRDPEVGARLRGKLDEMSFDPRTRQAFMHALADVEGEAAVPVIVELGKTPMLTLDAIRILAGLKSKQALPFLKQLSTSHADGYMRGQAGAAAREIEAQ